jgi:ribosomal protein S18 acetylase RimI-like enzyme
MPPEPAEVDAMWSRPIAPVEDLVIRRARTLDAAALARIQVDSWRESYAGIIPQAYLDGLTYAQHERQWRKSLAGRGWGFLAVWQGQIVGLAQGGRCRRPKGYGGELYLLYLLRAYQGRGIGRALFDAAHLELARRGFADLVVWVLADNAPARGFYERLGGDLVGQELCEVGGARLKQVAYAWPG